MYYKLCKLIRKRDKILQELEVYRFTIDSSTDDDDNYAMYKLEKKLAKVDRKLRKEIEILYLRG